MKNFTIIMALFLIMSIGCDKDQNNSSNKSDIQSLVGPTEPPKLTIYDCNEGIYCPDLDCFIQNPSNCTRADLISCNFDNMQDYYNAICCELNKFVNGCPFIPQNIPLGCYLFTKCFKNLETPPQFLALYPFTNPFRYCPLAQCGDYLCASLFGLPPVHHHMDLNIIAQNILINYAINIVNNNAPICPENNLPAKPIHIKFKTCYDVNAGIPLNCYPYDPNDPGEPFPICTNMSIRLEVEYSCCNNNE